MSAPVATLATRTAALGNETVALARRLGRPDLADLVVAEAGRWESTEAIVAVVGLPGAGSTSLVWALAGQDAVPGVPGSVLVEVRSADGPTGSAAAVVARSDGSSEQLTDLDPATLAAATRAGDVLRIDVHDCRLPPGVVLVDVGSAAGFRSAVRTAALSSDCVVVASPAAEPLGLREVEVLEEEAARLGSVHVAVTKADRFRGAPAVAESIRESVGRRGGSVLVGSVHSVSSRLAEEARDIAGSDPTDAAALDSESGIPALRDALLGSVVDGVAQLRLGNLLRVLAVAQTELGRVQSDRLADLRRPEEERQLRAKEIAGLQAGLRGDMSAALVAVADGVTLLREQLGPRLHATTTGILRTIEEVLAAPEGPETIADEVDRLLGLAEAELTEWLGTSVRTIAADVAEGVDDQLPSVSAAVEVDAHGAAPAPAEDPGARLRLATAMSSGMSGLGMLAVVGTHIGGAVDIFRVGTLGASVMVGLAVAARGARHSKAQREVARVRSEARARVETWRAAAQSEVRVVLLRVQRELEAGVKAAFEVRKVTLADELAMVTASDPLDREGIEDVRTTMAELGRLADRTRELLALVGGRRGEEQP